MKLKRLSRRDALGLIVKTGATLGAGSAFFLSLKTSPLQGAAAPPGPDPQEKPLPQRLKNSEKPSEKVLIGGAGSKIVFKISGTPGRHCGVSYVTADALKRGKPAPAGRGIIGEDGLCTIEVDLKELPAGKLFFRVVTAGASDFAKEARGTEAFEVETAVGAIARFGGVRERSLDNAATIATAASACFEKIHN